MPKCSRIRCQYVSTTCINTLLATHISGEDLLRNLRCLSLCQHVSAICINKLLATHISEEDLPPNFLSEFMPILVPMARHRVWLASCRAISEGPCAYLVLYFGHVMVPTWRHLEFSYFLRDLVRSQYHVRLGTYQEEVYVYLSPSPYLSLSLYIYIYIQHSFLRALISKSAHF
jgi:hypothetical protein